MDSKHITPDFSSPSSQSHTNGKHVDREPLYEDSTLNALMKQAEQLSEIESAIEELAESCSRIRRSLTTLVPALEVHMHGLQSEARRWKHTAQLSDEKYEQAFADLEGRMNSLNDHLDTTEQRLQEQHQKELTRLREEADVLRSALKQVRRASQRDPEHPFGKESGDNPDNIFDI